MEVQVQDTLTVPDRCRSEELRGWDIVKLAVEVGENGTLAADRPGGSAQGLAHRRSVDPLHHEVGSVVAELVHNGDGVALTVEVLHGLSFVSHRAAIT
jgi:hypothetical protein